MHLINLFCDEALNAVKLSFKDEVTALVLVTLLLKNKSIEAPEEEVFAISANWYLQVEPTNSEVERNLSNFLACFFQFFVCCRNNRYGFEGRKCKKQAVSVLYYFSRRL